jgi:bifunctional DNA-binding transcriptional regulator/antitoxin component of YhaV-PrlF toxin-antitoxin module
MMFLHDNREGVARTDSTLTERGQVSIPASIRKQMKMRPGQVLHWERISERECRVRVGGGKPAGPIAVLGFGPRLRGDGGRRTSEWMEELRAGERG